MPETLGERQASILRAIVREYIRSGEPVGSKNLAERASIQVSSATVRNEMARLEELGYVRQPHTSAGRIPTDRGYRFIVNEIKRPRPLNEAARRALEEELAEEPANLEDLLRRASDAVSRLTRHAAAILARRARPSTVRRLELFATGPHLASLVLIAENGRVEQRIVHLDDGATEADVEDLGRALSDELRGKQLSDAVRAVDERRQRTPRTGHGILDAVVSALRSLEDSEQHVVVHGAANLAGREDFEREELSQLYEALEHQSALLDVLASAFESPMTVRIGSEVDAEGLRSCSIVVARFDVGDGAGSVGVIGPTRMDYERVMGTANAVARLLENTFGAHEG